MYIRSLMLTNFRGANHLSLELNEKLNVFVGMNGAGKSSVLDASAILLSWLANRVKHAGTSGRQIVESDIKNGESSANLAITLHENAHAFNWNLAKLREGFHDSTANSNLTKTSELAKQLRIALTEHNGKTNIPLFAYYPVNRAVLDIPLRIREKHRFDLLSAYEGSLTSGANFRTFFEWFREREDLENEARRDQHEIFTNTANIEFPDPQLEAVRMALMHFMPEFEKLTVRRNPLRMEVIKQGERLEISQLSDGEKCLMAMIGDMARRVAIANPTLDNPLQAEGIVLIDEIDLHLHPYWQRRIIPKLTEVFPNIQFLISTHSPHVITHVQPENLFLLTMCREGLIAQRATESYGKTVERVLEDIMGLETTRPIVVNTALREIYLQIDQGDLTGAKDLILALEHKIGSDPELSKATVLIRRKELIGK